MVNKNKPRNAQTQQLHVAIEQNTLTNMSNRNNKDHVAKTPNKVKTEQKGELGAEMPLADAATDGTLKGKTTKQPLQSKVAALNRQQMVTTNNNMDINNSNNMVDQASILNFCMEPLQKQIQALLMSSDAGKEAQICKNSQTNTRRNSLTLKENEWKSGEHKRRKSESSTETKSEPSSSAPESSPATAETKTEQIDTENDRTLSKAARRRRRLRAAMLDRYVAIDCEMVGVGHNGQQDMLARVSIVNRQGVVLLDKFVKPWHKVIDYRTSISGIRPKDIENGEDFRAVQSQVLEILQGKILVGHAVRNDLAVLNIKHPFKNIRDTARYKPLSRLVANGRTPSLKLLSQTILGMEIQVGEHNSVEDARAAMKIYNRLRSEWEKYIQKHQRQ